MAYLGSHQNFLQFVYQKKKVFQPSPREQVIFGRVCEKDVISWWDEGTECAETCPVKSKQRCLHVSAIDQQQQKLNWQYMCNGQTRHTRFVWNTLIHQVGCKQNFVSSRMVSALFLSPPTATSADVLLNEVLASDVTRRRHRINRNYRGFANERFVFVGRVRTGRCSASMTKQWINKSLNPSPAKQYNNKQ